MMKHGEKDTAPIQPVGCVFEDPASEREQWDETYFAYLAEYNPVELPNKIPEHHEFPETN